MPDIIRLRVALSTISTIVSARATDQAAQE
jgi:hypothetical protein